MNNYKLEIEAIKPVEQSVNHVFAVDVSGSMYDVLPKMRSHIKIKKIIPYLNILKKLYYSYRWISKIYLLFKKK